ncbi:MAG: SDR family NAD(P)-dependent oxidoreductase [Planctomycetota bacterium]
MSNTQVALVTGVSSGLGHGLAEELLERGWEVLGTSRRQPEDLIQRDGFTFRAIDFSRLDEIAAPLRELIGPRHRFDVAILNAGVLGKIRDLTDTPLADLRHTMDVNVWANKVLLDTLFERATPAQVIAISSGAAVSGARGWNGYAISKAALNMLIAQYAAERDDTHFTALAPGLIDTAMQEYLCALPSRAEYPVVDRLKKSRGTRDMPGPREAAKQLVQVFPRLLESESGSFLDVRSL